MNNICKAGLHLMLRYLLWQSSWRGLCCCCHRNLVTRESREGWGFYGESTRRQWEVIQTDARGQPFTYTSGTRHFLRWHRFKTESTHLVTMIHPLIIGIISVNTTITIVYWSFILGDAYFKWVAQAEDKPKKLVTPAWGTHSQNGPDWMMGCCIRLGVGSKSSL